MHEQLIIAKIITIMKKKIVYEYGYNVYISDKIGEFENKEISVDFLFVYFWTE